MKDILAFQGENRWLSNFWPCIIDYNGLVYPSTENAYQAAKFSDTKIKKLFVNISAGESKRLGRKFNIIPEWNSFKESVMEELIAIKFKQGTVLADKLVKTFPVYLEEGNTWNDTFWGVCNGSGLNKLGIILMNQRDKLMEIK